MGSGSLIKNTGQSALSLRTDKTRVSQGFEQFEGQLNTLDRQDLRHRQGRNPAQHLRTRLAEGRTARGCDFSVRF